MLEKRVTVYLDTGATREHVLVVEDDDDYAKQINEDFIPALTGNPRGILGFTTPLCIYKVQNIIAIEFGDPPPPSEKLRMGYRLPSELNP